MVPAPAAPTHFRLTRSNARSSTSIELPGRAARFAGLSERLTQLPGFQEMLKGRCATPSLQEVNRAVGSLGALRRIRVHRECGHTLPLTGMTMWDCCRKVQVMVRETVSSVCLAS